MTVIRLYRKHEIPLSDTRGGPFKPLVKEQFNYASETINCLDNALSSPSRGYSGSGEGGDRQEGWLSLIAPYFFRTFIYGSFLGIAYYFFTLLMNTAQSDPSKFDVKMAKDIETRLDDVKGIDEIKDEIKNVIQIIKNPQAYQEKGAKLFKGVMLLG